MGGKAFHQTLPATAFPRIPNEVYNGLKAGLIPQLQSLYADVAVPFEAPEKLDHGDLDFVVASPKHNMAQGEESRMDRDREAVTQEALKKVLGAKFCILLDGNRTSNFAVPIAKADWEVGDDKFYQVDVHVCTDHEEWQRVVFFHGYGDLGMIMGLIAKNNGFALGIKGLKVRITFSSGSQTRLDSAMRLFTQIPDPPYPPFHLSSSPPEITRFLGLSMEAWERGFETKQDIFTWAASSRLFDPSKLRVRGPGIRKVKEDRTMYAEFVDWAVKGQPQRGNDMDLSITPEGTAALIEEALLFFNKKDEYESLAHSRSARARLKRSFTGTVVNDWTGLGGHWQGVKRVMDGVRERLNGEEGLLRVLETDGEEGLKMRVLEVRDKLAAEGMLKRRHATVNHDPKLCNS